VEIREICGNKLIKMKILFKIIQPVYSVWSYLVFFLFAFVSLFIAPLIIISGGKKYIHPLMRYYRFWSDSWFLLSLMKQDFRGYENFDNNRSYVIAGTHTSALDMFACASSIKFPFKTLAKAEMKKIPLIGFLFKIACVFVDRSNAESRKKSLDLMAKTLHEGTSILIMPEGTRNRTNKPLKDFHDGAFRMAIETQTPLLPIVLLNCRKLMPADSFLLTPGTIGVRFFKPIETTGMTEKDIPALKEKVYKMQEEVILREDEFFH